MKQIVIAAHGCFASGIKSTIELILGPQDHLTAIDCYLDEVDPAQKIADCIASFDEEDGIILCTDLAGGSVNQLALPYAARPNTRLVTGSNVPLLLELALLEDMPTEEQWQRILTEGREGLFPVTLDVTEDDDFDL